MITNRYEKDVGLYLYRVQVDSGKRLEARNYLHCVIMSSEVKLMYQSDIEINVNSRNLKLYFGDKNREDKKKFLLENDEFVINSFKVNTDPQGQSQTIYDKEMQELDLSQGELKFLSKNYEKSNTRLKLETTNLKEKENVLDKITTVAWEEVTPYLITLHVNFKENIFRLEEFDILTKIILPLSLKKGAVLRIKIKSKINILISNI